MPRGEDLAEPDTRKRSRENGSPFRHGNGPDHADRKPGKRYRTAFGEFAVRAPGRKSRLQGPHVMAHVTTDVAMADLKDAVFRHGKPLISAGRLGEARDGRFRFRTRAVPSVGQEYRIVTDALRGAGRDGEGTGEMRFKFIWNRMQLEHRFNDALARGDKGKAIDSYNALIEYSARHTYRIGGGTYTAAEIAGKGENTARAVADLETLRAASARSAELFGARTENATEDMVKDVLGGRSPGTIDLGSLSTSEQAKALKRVGQIATAARHGEIDAYSEDSVESLHDTELTAIASYFGGKETVRSGDAWRWFKGGRGGGAGTGTSRKGGGGDLAFR